MPERGGAPWFDEGTGFTIMRTDGVLEFEDLGGGLGHYKFDFDLGDLLPSVGDDDYIIAVVGVHLNDSSQLWGVSMDHNDHGDTNMSIAGASGLFVKGFTLFEFGDALGEYGTGVQVSANEFDFDEGDTVFVVCLSMVIKDVERVVAEPTDRGLYDTAGPVDREAATADDIFPFPDTDDHADMAPENTAGSNLWWTSALSQDGAAGEVMGYYYNRLPSEGVVDGESFASALIDDNDPTTHPGMVGLAYVELADCLVDPEPGLGQPARWLHDQSTRWPGVAGGYLSFAAATEEGWGIMSL